MMTNIDLNSELVDSPISTARLDDEAKPTLPVSIKEAEGGLGFLPTIPVEVQRDDALVTTVEAEEKAETPEVHDIGTPASRNDSLEIPHLVDQEEVMVVDVIMPRAVFDETALFFSARSGEFHTILHKLKEDASKWDMVIRAKDADHHTVLHWAALFDDTDFIGACYREAVHRMDVTAVSDWVNARSSNGQTALMWTCIRGHVKAMRVLYHQCGADVGVSDTLKADACILAVQHHQYSALLLLYKWMKASHAERHPFDTRDTSGCTVVHWAAYKGDILMLRLLSYFDADMNAIDNQGMTPLHRATSEGWSECAMFLVGKCQANPTLVNNKDESAADMAKRLENKGLMAAFSASVESPETGDSTQYPLGSKWSLPALFSICMSCTLLSFFADLFTVARGVLPVLFCICAVASVVLYIDLVVADAGTVAKRQKGKSAIEEFQESLDSPDSTDSISLERICVTCWENKPIERRIKHCSVCDTCVEGFDHHCAWINNCVAENNHRRFVGMVLAVFVGMVLYVWVSVDVVLSSSQSFWNIVLAKPLLVPAWLIHLCVVPWLAILVFHQLRAIALNMNTNELMNYNRYSHFWKTDESVLAAAQPHVDGCGDHEHGGCSHGKPPVGYRRFHNPFDKGGSMANCYHFWFKPTNAAYAKLTTTEIEMTSTSLPV